MKDDSRLSMTFHDVTPTEHDYIYSLFHMDGNKLPNKLEHIALFEALKIFRLKYEFKLILVPNENNENE